MQSPVLSTSSRAATLLSILFAVSGSARAQSMNIDLHDAVGTPADTYAAAASQLGHWNALTALQPNLTHTLNDLNGNLSPVTVVYTLNGGGGAFSFDNPNTTGDDEALLDDLMDVGSGTSEATFTFSGLTPTNFDVYTYSFAPDDRVGFLSEISVAGSSNPSQIVGGADWGGSHVQGETYSLHSVVAAGGKIEVTIKVFAGFASVNGFQIVEIGGPACATSFCVQTKPTSVAGCLPELKVFDCTSTTGMWNTTKIPMGTGVTSTVGMHLYVAGPGIGQSTFTAPTIFGTLCLQGFLRVLPPLVTGGTPNSCTASWSYDFGANFATLQGIDPLLQVGNDINVQGWYRDPPSPGTANFTNAVFYTIQ